ncbi:unnamed protein product [Triticum turgidum subsp. durum]|uniref:2-oxoglutarate/malate translocator n=1 Tax=Triticum turgidum subsp. durum TaxID=4567 RepID=A0A9R0ZC47_TRITD|nr:unnamed protein product [Triticum turgidum subsp. durum]
MTIATKNSTTSRRGVGFIVPHAFIFVTMLREIFKEDGITIMCHSSLAWQLLSIFLSTIAGLVLGPLPVGAWAFLGLTATVATGTLPFTAAFGAFTNEVIWLIVISFFFARGFVKTGLGDRVATYFVKWLGGSTLGLSYGLTISEACIAPAMPSTTARAGGVFLPIVKSLSLSAGSKPNDPSAKKLGAYLVQSQLQVHFAQMVINFSRDR